MLFTLVAILLVLWLLGAVALPSLGAIVHLILIVALVVLIYQLFTGRRA